LNSSASFFPVIVCFCAINLKKTAFSREMPFFTAVKIFSLFLWGRNFLKSLLLEASLSFSKYRISLPIYFVGVPLLLPLLKIVIFILTSFFLRPSAEIIVEANSHLNQLGSSFRKFLDGHSIFNALGQSLIKLGHFGSFVLSHFSSVLRKFNQIFGH
jgi:hypothetical protein